MAYYDMQYVDYLGRVGYAAILSKANLSYSYLFQFLERLGMV